MLRMPMTSGRSSDSRKRPHCQRAGRAMLAAESDGIGEDIRRRMGKKPGNDGRHGLLSAPFWTEGNDWIGPVRWLRSIS